MSCRNSPSRIGTVVALGCASVFLFVSVSPASAQLTWTGTVSNAWDINTTTNWTDSLTLSQTLAYTDGLAVIFDNTPGVSGNTAVNIVSTVQPASITFNNSIVPYSFSGAAISGTGSVLLSSSAGSVTFSSSNSYTGGTIVNGGALTVGDDNAISGGSLSLAAAGTVNFISLNPSIVGLAGAGSIVLGNAAAAPPTPTNLTVNSTSNSTFSGVISEAAPGLGFLTTTGRGMVTLTGANTYSGGTVISAGTVSVDNGGASGTLGSGPITNNATLIFNRGDTALNMSQVISGSGGVIQSGTGMVTFSAPIITRAARRSVPAP